MYHCLHCALQSFLLPPEGEANGTRITFCGHHLPFTITITLYFLFGQKHKLLHLTCNWCFFFTENNNVGSLFHIIILSLPMSSLTSQLTQTSPMSRTSSSSSLTRPSEGTRAGAPPPPPLPPPDLLTPAVPR